MPRPSNMPDDLDTIGKRVRWWREHREMTRKNLAKKCGMPPTTLGDLENGRTVEGTSLHLISAALGLSPVYLQHGKGEPEAGAPQDPLPEQESWPLPGIPRSELIQLDLIERTFLESRMFEALAEIKNKRRKDRKG